MGKKNRDKYRPPSANALLVRVWNWAAKTPRMCAPMPMWPARLKTWWMAHFLIQANRVAA